MSRDEKYCITNIISYLSNKPDFGATQSYTSAFLNVNVLLFRNAVTLEYDAKTKEALHIFIIKIIRNDV